MKLVIAEKPMLARDIARAVCGVQVSEKTLLPISGNGYTVIACSGHLLELVEPDAVNPAWADRYDLDLLPISIPDWPKEPAVVRDRETGEVIDSKEPLIDKIAALLPQADLVIHAGDPDDEGQLIVDEVLDYLGYTGEVLRVYVNDNITKNIMRAFDHLVPNEGCRPAGAAANARSIADKCFGVNESRLASTRLHGGFYVGRVQTPTLGLVVARDEAIENHVTRKFYELTATGGCPDADSRPTFKFKPGKDMLAGEKHVFDAAPLETIKAKMDGSDATFTTVISEKTENPPLPYNLTVLLSDMSERFGFTAAKTQQITQDLRDKYKAITYNRSDSQYLKEEHFAQAPAVLAQAMENVGATWPLDYSIHSKAFNEKNVTAHHGIIPQEIEAPVGDMTEDEVKVYTAIVERYAAQFLPPAVYDVSTSSFDAEGGTFQAVSTRLREAGFKSVFPHMSKSGKAFKAVTAEATFTPDHDHGTVDVTFTFDCLQLAGQQVVAFETLYRLDKEICAHADIDDMGQTVTVIQPTVKTAAIDGIDGDKDAVIDPEAVISDKVLFDRVVPGASYEIHGIVMDAETGLPLLSGEGEGDAPTADELADFWQKLVDLTGITVAEPLDAVEGPIADEPQDKGFLGWLGSLFGADGKSSDAVDEPTVEEMLDGVWFPPVKPDRKAIEALLADNPEIASRLIRSSAKVTPKESYGEANLDFAFDASEMAGKDAVVFELLVKDGYAVAAHADIDDENQTVSLFEPSIGTTAKDGVDGDQSLVADGKATIVDTVS